MTQKVDPFERPIDEAVHAERPGLPGMVPGGITAGDSPDVPGNTKPTATGEHHRHGRRQPPGHGQRPATTLPLQPQGETRGDLGQPQETNRHFATGEARKLFLAPRRHDFGRVVAPHPHNPQLDSTTYYAIGRFFIFQTFILDKNSKP
jgi:hypothetical protein